MKSLRKNSLSSVALLALTLSVILFSCKKEKTDSPKPVGELNLEIDVSLQVLEYENKLKAADIQLFEITIFNEDGSVNQVFERFADMPSAIKLEAGNYFIEANSGNLVPAAFDNDYYAGFSDVFSIIPGEKTDVTINCKLANVMITVTYSSNTQSGFDDYHTTVSSFSGSLIFDADETRSGYFEVNPLDIEAVLTFQENEEQKTIILEGRISSPEAGRNYEIIVDVPRNGGDAGINIIADESFENEMITLNMDNIRANEPAAGDLIVSEFMYNPHRLSDSEGEWIELYNTSSLPIQLENLIIRRASNGDSYKIDQRIVIKPNDYIVMARSKDAVQHADIVYGSAISLPNSAGDAIILLIDNGSGEIELSRVDYGEEGFPSTLAGESLQLDAGHLNHADAGNGLFWCAATSLLVDGEFGTPGSNNDFCP